MAWTSAAEAQTAAKPDAVAPLSGPTTPKKKFPTGGVWHRFAKKDDASGAAQGQSSASQSLGMHPNTRLPRDGTGVPSPRQGSNANRLGELEKQMWELVNQDRLKPDAIEETNGRAVPLRWNESLARVARTHSRNMVERRYFSHVDPDGTTFAMRISGAGIPWVALGENIAIYDTVSGAESAFMSEPRFQHNHRANILDSSYTEVGIGVAQGPDGSLYITQDFLAAPPRGGAGRSAP